MKTVSERSKNNTYKAVCPFCGKENITSSDYEWLWKFIDVCAHLQSVETLLIYYPKIIHGVDPVFKEVNFIFEEKE